MELHVTFRHLDPSDTIKTHVEHGLDKLKKYLVKPETAHVILAVEKFRRIAEITLTENGNRITATEESADMYESIDGALAKIEIQLKKYKDKVKSHKAGSRRVVT